MSHRPKLLDLYCCAGGAGEGYARAGFDVDGVDIAPQPNYPHTFINRDALIYIRSHGHKYDAFHASPPCQPFTAYRRRGAGVGASHLDLIDETRDALEATGKPYVVENVAGARVRLVNPITLCGSSFGLDVRRHRLFESNIALTALPCDHSWQLPRFPPATNRTNLRRTVEVGVYRIPLHVQRQAMGIDWMSLAELSQAIPPAYTEHLGAQLLAQLAMVGGAAA